MYYYCYYRHTIFSHSIVNDECVLYLNEIRSMVQLRTIKISVKVYFLFPSLSQFIEQVSGRFSLTTFILNLGPKLGLQIRKSRGDMVDSFTLWLLLVKRLKGTHNTKYLLRYKIALWFCWNITIRYWPGNLRIEIYFRENLVLLLSYCINELLPFLTEILILLMWKVL